MTKLSISLLGLTLGLCASAAWANPLQISNPSKQVMEISGVVGGYSSNNPITHKTVLSPYPGSKLIRGHIMLYHKNQPGHYSDNILFIAKKAAGKWQMQEYNLYKRVE